mmetsp:Transcript_4286/g.12519  ORF Transcript_4286/g.12519 Transcript_4286/m.12519 type:complete len:303 (-) Transcript_4286:164-1072(-)
MQQEEAPPATVHGLRVLQHKVALAAGVLEHREREDGEAAQHELVDGGLVGHLGHVRGDDELEGHCCEHQRQGHSQPVGDAVADAEGGCSASCEQEHEQLDVPEEVPRIARHGHAGLEHRPHTARRGVFGDGPGRIHPHDGADVEDAGHGKVAGVNDRVLLGCGLEGQDALEDAGRQLLSQPALLLLKLLLEPEQLRSARCWDGKHLIPHLHVAVQAQQQLLFGSCGVRGVVSKDIARNGRGDQQVQVLPVARERLELKALREDSSNVVFHCQLAVVAELCPVSPFCSGNQVQQPNARIPILR